MPNLPELEPEAGALLYRTLFASASDIVFTLDRDDRVTTWNPSFERAIGIPSSGGAFPLCSIVPPDQRQTACQRLQEARYSGRVELDVLAANGGHARYDISLHSIPAGSSSTVVAIGRDVTAERDTERLDAARRSISSMLALDAPVEDILERLTDLVDKSFPCAVSAVSRSIEGKLRYIAGRLPETLRDALTGMRIGPMCASAGSAAYLERPVVATDIATDPTWSALGPAAQEHGFHSCWSAPILGGAGEVLGTFDVYLRQPLEPTHDRMELLKSAANVVAGAIQHHAHTEDITYRATHDVATHLPNRYALEKRVGELIAADPERSFALLCVGLGSMKLVNETFGQRLGDEFLRAVAARLSCCLLPGEMLARIGDDNLIVLVLDGDEGAPAVRAREIRDELSSPVMAAGREIFAAASVGIGIYPKNGCDPESLVSAAMIALAHGKRQGGPAVTAYTPEMLSRMTKRLDLRNELHRALRREEFSIHFQPQFNLHSGALVGQEALLRWQTPHGAVAPSDFIPIAEESGLILPLGDWTLRHACRCALERSRVTERPVRCAVNISGIQLAQADFVDRVVEILDETGFPAHLLDLELTETALMRDLDTAAERMFALRLLGVTLSVDDFGAGYSSLSRLRQLPLDSLKIDLSFVREIVDTQIPPTVQAIVALGRGLGMNVIAEGVETQDQLRVLQRIGCDEGQGYLLGRPAPADEPSGRPIRLAGLRGLSPVNPMCFSGD